MDDKEKVTFGKNNFVNYKNELITNFYNLKETVGSGSTSIVKKGIHKITNQVRAVKIIKKKDYDEQMIFNEMNMLIKLNHPNIIQIYEIYDDEKNYYIVEELCQGGALLDYLSEIELSETIIAGIMKQILSIVAYLHSNGITHRYFFFILER